MGRDVDAVIAALKVALDEAQKSADDVWMANAANRWIDRLPGAWFGRWRQLRLKADSWGQVDRDEFIGHVRAAIAYLETNREGIRSRSLVWSRRRGTAPPTERTLEHSLKATGKGSRLLN